MTDAVIEKFDLRARYQEKYQETTREALWDHCAVKTLSKPGLVQLTCEDKDPKFVQQLLDVLRRPREPGVPAGERGLGERGGALPRAARGRAAPSGRADCDADARVPGAAPDRRHRDPEQGGGLRPRRQSTPGGSRSRWSSTSPDPSPRTTRRPPSSSSRSWPSWSGSSGIWSGPRTSPDRPRRSLVQDLHAASFRPRWTSRSCAPSSRASTAIGRSRRRRSIIALERLESARANEARDVSTFQVLDPPALPTKKSRPKGSLVLAGFALAGLSLSVGWEWWRRGGAAATLGAALGAPTQPSSVR